MKALILGATGLVGNELLELLEEDARFEKIELVSRRELELKDMKVINHIVDYLYIYIYTNGFANLIFY